MLFDGRRWSSGRSEVSDLLGPSVRYIDPEDCCSTGPLMLSSSCTDSNTKLSALGKCVIDNGPSMIF